jgi:Transcriptional regulator, AbiEi antitoxin
VDDWAQLLERQAGVVTRQQVLAHGVSVVELARRVRRGELVRVHRGVYVRHNGPLSWLERAWAAVLWAEPAGLWGPSALRAFHQRELNARDEEPIHLLVDRDRRLVAPPGVVLHRRALAAERIQGNLSPPRARYEDAVLDLAEAAGDDISAVGILADACGSRRTNAARLAETLTSRPWVHRRAWLAQVLEDVARGTCSVLEYGYLTRVERPHGLPDGHRQVSGRQGGRTMWRDVLYELGLVVELDGRIGHSSVKDRARDLDRDLDAAVHDELRTVRLGYAQVFDEGCRTAVRIGALLNRLGWPGAVQACPKCGARDEAA